MKTLLLGDVCATQVSDPYFRAKDMNTLFTDVLPLFERSDYTVVNLECAITESENRIKKFGPNLKSCPETADVLKSLGVKLCGMSNNHIFDFGIEGARDTMAALDRVGIAYTGFGENYEDSRKNYIVEKDGQRIAFVAVCEHEYSYALEDRMGSRPFDEFHTIEDIRDAKEKADRVIVCYHGGKEMCHYPSPRLIRVCRAMVRAGADLIITGEGRLDRQSLQGKTVSGVCRRAGDIPAYCIAGCVDGDREELKALGLADIFALTDICDDTDYCISHAGQLITKIVDKIPYA